MTSPKIVSSRAVEEMSANSEEIGVKIRPRFTLAASPRPPSSSGMVAGRAVCVTCAPPADPFPHRLGEAMAPIHVAVELVEGGSGGCEEHGVAVMRDSRRQFHDAVHDLFSVAGDDLPDLHFGRVSLERRE